MLAHLKQAAAKLDLPFGDRSMTFNSRRAQELAKWAEDSGKGEVFHRAVFQAYFGDGRNIARTAVLTAIAADVGLDPDGARAVMRNGSYRETVDRDWQRSRQLGITAVPTFVMNGRHLVGAQTYRDLTRLVETGDSKIRPLDG
jgi:predicted DsbA family dithiol-disulfide isomerase